MKQVSTTMLIYSNQIEVTISGTYSPLHRGRFEKGGGQLEPDEPEMVEDITAKLGRDTIELDEEDMERAEAELIEAARGE